MPTNKITEQNLLQAIVNAPFSDKVQAAKLGLGIVVLLMVNKKDKMIDRVALSETEQADGAVKVSVKPFKKIRVPINTPTNIVAKAIATGEHQMTDDWRYLFNPALTAKEARLNQASAGIGCSCVYPLEARDGGALIFSYFLSPHDITDKHHKFMKKYSENVSLQLKAVSA